MCSGGNAQASKTGLEMALARQVNQSGPVSMARYMRECLTNPEHGYYTTNADIGAFGDFTTSPEMTPLFGALIGKWVAWAIESTRAARGDAPIQLVELGPGRGTLMSGILASLPPETRANVNVWFVEISPKLREAQAQKLAVDMDSGGAAQDSAHTAAKSAAPPPKRRYLQPFGGNGMVEIDMVSESSAPELSPLWFSGPRAPLASGTQASTGTRVHWVDHISAVPEGSPLVAIANEFFDALPTHQFSFSGGKWNEVMVGADEDDKDGIDVVHVDIGERGARIETKGGGPGPSEGDIVEVCPEASAIAAELARRVANGGGAALAIDYGDEEPRGTLRAVSRKRGSTAQNPDLHPLDSPGAVDMTADAHFGALQEAMSRGGGDEIIVLPLQPQAYLLTELMGDSIKDNLEVMRRGLRDDMPKEERDIVMLGALVDRESLGSQFKCVACTAKDMPSEPVGWQMRKVLMQMEKLMEAQQGGGGGA